MFAEGSCSNGTHILKFMKGAFFAEKRVRPIVMKYSWSYMSTDYGVMDMMPLLVLAFSQFVQGLTCELLVLPDFQPNEFLFEKHADRGKERWEVFAWAVRDVMSKEGEIPVSDVSKRLKVPYYSYMNGYPGAIDVSNLSLYQIEELQN